MHDLSKTSYAEGLSHLIVIKDRAEIEVLAFQSQIQNVSGRDQVKITIEEQYSIFIVDFGHISLLFLSKLLAGSFNYGLQAHIFSEIKAQFF